MDLMMFGIGIFLTITGAILIWLRFRCDEAVAISWFMFIGGIILTIVGYIATPITEVSCGC